MSLIELISEVIKAWNANKNRCPIHPKEWRCKHNHCWKCAGKKNCYICTPQLVSKIMKY